MTKKNDEVKFIYSEKATKIDKIFTVNLTLCSKCQIDGEDFVNYKSRPCGFGQSLGRPIVQSFSHFFGRPKKKLSSLREYLVSLWEFLVH